tara:strand:- start:121 stop:324 length:204 start_codon:yes stop_codon:yes gene_type:complete
VGGQDPPGGGGRTEKIILVSQKFGPQKSGNIAKLGLCGVELEIVLLRFFYIVFFSKIIKNIQKFKNS